MPSKLLCLINYGAHGLPVSMNQPYAMRCNGRTDPEGVRMSSTVSEPYQLKNSVMMISDQGNHY